MCSRACFLLRREFQELKENNYVGIIAFPVSEDMMEWEADIEGLQNTIWHVDQYTGRPCIDFLDNFHHWNSSYTLSSILLTLQAMLSNPVLNNPVNLEAARILIEDESTYRLIVEKLFREPLQLKVDSYELLKDSDKCIRSIKIPFDDYYKTWSEIATSKAAECYRTPLLEDPSFIRQYNQWKRMQLKHNEEWDLKFAAAMAQYARETKGPSKASYQSQSIHLCPTPNSQSETEVTTESDDTKEGWGSDGHRGDESWEDEVEDLIAWTSTLNPDALED
uniref:Ubiquitin conjugating enzyme E2 U n=1 Tax=Molossus molossus TaxID=27622 RepID=A0A7J8FCY9_MOLMO|nr:ubiquitin conjugating enzyme E2 U [Molossus molossus]